MEEEQELRHRLHLQGLYLEARRLGGEVKEELSADGTAPAGTEVKEALSAAGGTMTPVGSGAQSGAGGGYSEPSSSVASVTSSD